MTVPARLAAFARDHGSVCHWCGAPVLFDVKNNHGLAPSRDHLKPKSQRGTDAPSNLVLAHRSCNSRRGTMEPAVFAELIRGVAKQVDAAGLNPVCPSGRAGSTPAAPTRRQWASMRDFWPEQNLAEIGTRVARDLAREHRRGAAEVSEPHG
jgi:HNH endonuclease